VLRIDVTPQQKIDCRLGCAHFHNDDPRREVWTGKWPSEDRAIAALPHPLDRRRHRTDLVDQIADRSISKRVVQPDDIAPHFNSCARMRQRQRRPCVRHQSFIGVGASASFGLVEGGSSGVVSFDPEAGTSSAALTSTGAMASVNAFAGSIGADPDAGATFGAATFNLAASPASSGGRGRGNGGDDTVRWC
jgi:hypothetical protein